MVEAVINGTGRLSMSSLADYLSRLHCAFQPLRGECRYVTSVVKKSGEGQLQVRIVEPARRLIADQTPLLQSSDSGFEGNGVRSTQKVEPGHVYRSQRANSRCPCRLIAAAHCLP